MSKTYSAGIVTAYGAAKRAGYQGTYEDFCRQQAGYAENAAAVEQAKNTAVSAANTATTKAGEATTAATAAQTAKAQTEQSASQALTDIVAARSGAISAVQTEGATQTANATAQAQAAAQSATTASTKASEASASATSAGQSATNAAASATNAAQSASDAQDVLDSIPADYSALSANVSQLQADLGTLTQDAYKAFPTDTASGAVASFEDGADDIPLKSLVIDINPVQAGTGDPSPTNVRPITGWTGANVARTGKNLFDYDESKVSVGETPTGAFRSYYPTGITNCTVTFSAYLIDSSSVTSSFVNIGKLVNGKLNVINSFLSTNGDITNRSVTFAEGEEAVLITAVSETSGITSNLPKYNIQLELGSTVTAYEPYAGQSYPISWETEAGTVYGGMLDVLTGVLTVNKATIDLGTLTWRYNVAQGTQKAGFYTDVRLPNAVLDTPLGTAGNILCSSYTTASYAEVYSTLYDVDKAISIRTNGGLRVVDSAYSDATIFKTAMSGVILVYPLAEPVVYQLTPQEVSSLLDINNIWADTGNANVEYRADTVLYADKVTKKSDNSAMIAPVESSYTATRNYTVNQLLTVDNVLYKVTANIANGGTITPNTNVVATTLSEVILALA